ncbi:MAG TPA: hypothetical protein VK815_14925 [Candidatus Acidoferrales bacterium]|jgi:hypothetical protein|nr:hypothetical protein [Candidatus Acidoferrales bacterium]
MPIASKSLREHIKNRDLISIRRDKIDSHSIQAFVLACSKTLILLQYVHDFRLDGFMLLRREDITGLKTGNTNHFQRQLLLTEGVLDQVDFAFRAPIQSFDSFLASLPPDEIVIVEDEVTDPKEFLIGTVSHIADGTVSIHHFTGVGRLVEPPAEIATTQITSCQIRTSYSRFYQRHFERIKKTV